MTAKSLTVARTNTTSGTFAHQTWDIAFATDIEFTSFVVDIFASDTYTLKIDGVTVETKAVTGPSTGTTFTPGAPIDLAAGIHTFELIPTSAKRFYYNSAFPATLSGDTEFGVWGRWSLSTTDTPPGTINFNDTAGQATGGMATNTTTATARSGQTWDVTFDVDVDVLAYAYQFKDADTYNLKIDGTTVATVVATAGLTSAFLPASPVRLAAGTHTFKIEPTANRNYYSRTTTTPLLGSSHITTWAVWSEGGGTSRVAGRLGFVPIPTGTLGGELPGALEGAFTGSYDGPIPGHLDGVLPTATGYLNGTYAAPSSILGHLDGVLPGILLGGFQGRYRGLLSTDTTNGVDGRSRGGGAILEFDPPEDSIPEGAFTPEAVVKAMAFPFPDIVDGVPVWDQNALVTLEKPQAQDLVEVGGKGLTNWRMTEPDHQPVKIPSYELTDPFAYGPSGDLFVPRIAGYFERPGYGDLGWAKKWTKVRYKRRSETGSTIDYVGVVVGIRPAPDGLILNVAGDLSGRLAAMLRPAPPARRVQDLGQWASYVLGNVHKHISPTRGPVTGIRIPDGGGSGMTQESWAANICAMSQTRSGARRTLMPKTWGQDLWELRLQDLDTVHYTGFFDGDRISADLLDDALEEPNRFYGSGISPAGTRWRNTEFPNYIQGDPPPYPMAGGADMVVGTTDDETINGDGVAVLWLKLRALGLIPWTVAFSGVYTERIAELIEDIQDAAGLDETGIMTPATWNAVFNLQVTGYHHGGRVAPLIQDKRIDPWLRGSNGTVIGRNPNYDPKVQPVDRIIDFDSGVTKDQARDWIRGERNRTNAKNWAGTITINNVGLWAGQVNDEDIAGLTEDDIVAPAAVRPGKNFWEPHFDGGTLFHIAKVTMSEDRQSATLTVDTQGRDYLELKAIIARNREARRSIRRAWLAQNQPGRQTGNLVIHDEHFGILDEEKRLDGDIWNVFPVVIGQMGTVQKIVVRTKDRPAEFCIAFFSKKPTRHQLQAVLGNPHHVDSNGETCWERDSTKAFRDTYVLLYEAGTGAQPCGYGTEKGYFSNHTRTSHPLTGEHRDHATWSYLADSENDPVIWCVTYPQWATTIEAGQMLWALEDDVT